MADSETCLERDAEILRRPIVGAIPNSSDAALIPPMSIERGRFAAGTPDFRRWPKLIGMATNRNSFYLAIHVAFLWPTFAQLLRFIITDANAEMVEAIRSWGVKI